MQVVSGCGHAMSAWDRGLEPKALEELGATGRDLIESEPPPISLGVLKAVDHINKTLGPALLEKASWRSLLLLTLSPDPYCFTPNGNCHSPQKYLRFFLWHMP